ncbi:MAG: dephospho-CoA kinase [Candidatus Omnitrophota bacterium]|nr:dephospho-CoA kinase [Candidatus Omnitrophota bacterium]
MAKKLIGITGGLASGKTTVADMFVVLGAVKIDADEIAHRLLEEDNEVRRKVGGLFGDDILTSGSIDRRKLAEKVFSAREKLDQLCRIIHPVIIQRIKDRIRDLGDSVIVIDAPLLIEAGLNDYVDVVIVVTARVNIQIERAKDRGISEEEARNVLDNQMPLWEKTKFADYIIENDTDLQTIKEGVKKIWQKM